MIIKIIMFYISIIFSLFELMTPNYVICAAFDKVVMVAILLVDVVSLILPYFTHRLPSLMYEFV